MNRQPFSSMSNRRSILAMILVVALACAALLLVGCADKTPTAKPASSSSSSSGQAGEYTSRAMVVYANGDQVMFVDQDTQTPYIPTLPDDNVFNIQGQEIDEDSLTVGNIVEVIGNGIMLESYPGQYPGIYRVQILEEGAPADAEQYADIVSTVFAEPDPNSIPTATVEYATNLAVAAIMLEPYDYEFAFVDPGFVEIDGAYTDANGNLLDSVIDARITDTVQATASFSHEVTQVKIERRALIKGLIDTNADSVDVPCTLNADGTATFSMEPNFVYEIEAEFANGEADYVFYTQS